MDQLQQLKLELHSLVIFRSLLADPVIKRLLPLLDMKEQQEWEQIQAYADFTAALFQEGESLTAYLWDRLVEAENRYVLKRAHQEPVGDIIVQSALHELEVLEKLSRLTAAEVKGAMRYTGYLPEWQTESIPLKQNYLARMERLDVLGYGIYSRHHMFVVQERELLPVNSPDPVRLSDLKGYERERRLVVDNTLALLKGKPSANVLLYGDAGCGKSSTVKALANEFWDQGLRLVEIKKNQLLDIAAVVETIGKNPLKFILFIDDLSFAQDNEEIGAIKAILEGSATSKTNNMAIYATSNRRHLVKEKFSDRSHDDIHRNETIQEQISLSERFGLSVHFGKPNKGRYLEIVHQLAYRYGLPIPEEELSLQAERYALERGGRSPRAARQFVDALRSSLEE